LNISFPKTKKKNSGRFTTFPFRDLFIYFILFEEKYFLKILKISGKIIKLVLKLPRCRVVACADAL